MPWRRAGSGADGTSCPANRIAARLPPELAHSGYRLDPVEDEAWQAEHPANSKGNGKGWGNLDFDVNLMLSDKAWDSNGQLNMDTIAFDGFLGSAAGTIRQIWTLHGLCNGWNAAGEVC